MCKLVKQTLTQHVNAIKKNEEQAKKNTFEIAVRLNIISAEKLWEQESDEYKNMADFANRVFGYAKSTTCNYIKLAEQFLNVTTTEKGKTEIRTICAHIEKDGKGEEVVNDYGIGQLNAVGKLTPEQFIQADSDGIISPDMSVSQIKKAIKDWLNPDESSDGDGDSRNENESTFDAKTAENLIRDYLVAAAVTGANEDYLLGVVFALNVMIKITNCAFGEFDSMPDANGFMHITASMYNESRKYMVDYRDSQNIKFSY